MLCLLASFAASENETYQVTVSRSIKPFHQTLEKGDVLYLSSPFPELVVVLTKSKGVKISSKLSNKPNDMSKKSIPVDSFAGKHFPGYAIIEFISDNSSEEVVVSGSAMALPDECKSNFWYTNKANEQFSLDNKKIYLPGFKTCALFSVDTDYELWITMDLEKGSSLSYKSEVPQHFENKLGPITLPMKPGYFLLSLDANAKSCNLNMSVPTQITPPDVPGSGYLLFSNNSLSSVRKVMLLCTASIFLVGLIVAIYFIYKSIRPSTKGYVGIPMDDA